MSIAAYSARVLATLMVPVLSAGTIIRYLLPARNPEYDLFNFLGDDDFGNSITRKDLVNVEYLNHRWKSSSFMFGLRRVTTADKLSEFTWLMILIVAALDTVMDSSSVQRVVSELLSQILEEEPAGMEYVMHNIHHHIEPWRSVAIVRRISIHIKPQNILVHNGQMIYTDFGIAFDASGQDTTTSGFPGAHTKRYCAPEVAQS
jgi:hypothetical protein